MVLYKICFARLFGCIVSALFHKLNSAYRCVSIEIGLDCYQTVQPEIYDLKEIKRKYGDRLCFWGAISTQKALPNLNAAQIKAIIDETVSVMSVGGGYILAPTHAIPKDVPPENVIAMLEHFKKF